MIVFEHGHGTKVEAMRIAATDQHAIFLNEPKAGGGLAGAGESVGVAGGTDEGENTGGSVGSGVKEVYEKGGRGDNVGRVCKWMIKVERMEDVLCCYTGASCKCVQGYSFA